MAGGGLAKLAWVAAGIAAVHGYLYLTTEAIHPCDASGKRLLAEYGPAAMGVALAGTFGIPPEGKNPAEREILAKGATIERFGVLGCYWPALLGWRSVPGSATDRTGR